MKRFAAAVLILCFAAFTACSSANGKDANKIESEKGYAFEYEEGWERDVSALGIALKSPPDAAGISQALILINTGETGIIDVEEYWAAYESSLKDTFSDYALKKKWDGEGEGRLGGEEAVRVEYTATIGGSKKHFALALCIQDGTVYNLLLSADETVFEPYSSCFEKIIKTFVFTESKGENSAAFNPGGRVESPNGDYAFDYSQKWILVRNDGMTAVRLAEGKATISVMAFALPQEKSSYGVNAYWDEYEAELKSEYPGYVLTAEYKENEPKLGGVAASRKEYTISADSSVYRYIQVICITEGYVYSVLFTADEHEFAEFADEFDLIIHSFTFT